MNQINFLPETFRLQAEIRRRKYRHMLLLVIFAVSLVGWAVVERGRNLGPRDYAAALEAEVKIAREQMSEMVRLRSEQQSLLRQVELQRELSQPIGHTQVIAVLSQILPPSVALTDLEVDTHRPPPQPLEEPGKKKRSSSSKTTTADTPVEDYLQIDLQAVAPDDLTVANVIGDLADHSLFEQVTMKYSRPTQRQGIDARQFRLSMRVRLDRKFELEVAHAD
ncbi:MAG: hypothetical protein IT445_17655 [Phycisphaeraceae bacterium]|nr:hypothetical protein [Phycisphaeraceae bacterium]